jgi:hypothetical protein
MIIKRPLMLFIALSLLTSVILIVPQSTMAIPSRCPDGYSMVAYYDWENGTFGPDAKYLDIISFTNIVYDPGDYDLQSGTWEVTGTPKIPIYFVVISDGNNVPSHEYGEYLPNGTLGPENFSYNDLDGFGISNIAFCSPQYPVTLASFIAQASRGTVNIEWVTATEIDTAGFMLYRSTNLDGPRVQVNASLLGANGDGVTGASYRFTDSPGYGSFYYWLEDVDYSGMSSLHGPAYVNVLSAIRRPSYRPSLPGK